MSTYCSAIDVGLFVYTTGKVKTCCSGDQDLGDINHESIDTIFAKDRFIEIRNNIRNNVSDPYCAGCSATESISLTSTQKHAFNSQFEFQNSRNLKLIDIRWSNVCNLMCRYCNVTDSSEWSKTLNIPIANVNKKYNESLLTLVNDNKETIQNVYLLGGEPLLQSQNVKLLNLLDKNVKIDVLTNLSLKLENNAVYQKLKDFKNVHWNISFDNVGDKFEYVRHGAVWQLLCYNLEKLQNDFGSNIVLHPVYSLYNAHCVLEYYQFADYYGLPVSWQLALPRCDLEGWATDSFVVFGHNAEIIAKAIDEIVQLGQRDQTLEDIKQKLGNNIEMPNKAKDFLRYTKKLESTITSVNTFKNLWPDLNQLLELGLRTE